jgi:hypothetical protein
MSGNNYQNKNSGIVRNLDYKSNQTSVKNSRNTDKNANSGTPGTTKAKPIQLIVTSKTQTGEVYQVAAALALDPNTDVLVVDNEKWTNEDPLIKFYQRAANASSDPKIRQRVRSLCFEQPTILYKALTKGCDLIQNLSEQKSVEWIKNSQKSDLTWKNTVDLLNEKLNGRGSGEQLIETIDKV